MKAVGIIAEYNPFHNGHAYHLKRAREMTGADYCVVVLGGDFVQRGAPALMDKHLRTACALANGADLVIELPVCYATSSAEHFAKAAVTLLDRLGVVDSLCFGSECGDIQPLMAFARELLEESPAFQRELDRRLRLGLSYPQARNEALVATAPHLTAHIGILSTPNNILGIEYCKAILAENSAITPYTLRRTGASYHDNSLNALFCSASAIRESMRRPEAARNVTKQAPASARELAKPYYLKTYPIFAEDLSLPLHYCLLSREAAGFAEYLDIDRELSDRIRKLLPKYRDFSSFCELLKSKNRTYVRIARSLLHILLDIRKSDFLAYEKEGRIFYARMLGFRESAAPLLSALKRQAAVPLLSKLADAEKQLTKTGNAMLEKDVYASHVYQSVVRAKYPAGDGAAEINEYKKPIVKM